MAIYFTTEANRYFTANVQNAQDILPAGALWTLSLRSKLSHVSPVYGQTESETGLDLSIDVVNSNDRYTTFRLSNNINYDAVKNALKNGVYTYQIGWKTDTLTFVPLVSGVTQVFTQASIDPAKEIIKYTSTNEDNSGFVYYSDTL